MLVVTSGPSTALTNRWSQSSMPIESINISDEAESVSSSVDFDQRISHTLQEEEDNLALDLPIYFGIFEVLKFQHKNAPPPEPKKEIIIHENKVTEASTTASWRDDDTPQAQTRTTKEIIIDQDKLTEASIDVSWKDDTPIPQVPKEKKEMIFDDGPIYKNKITESSIDVSWGIETLPKDEKLLHEFDHVFVDEDKQKAKVENEISQTKHSHDSHLIENILKEMELEKKHEETSKDLLDDAMATDDSLQNMEHVADEINTEKQNSGILQTFNFLFSGNKENKNERLNPEPQSEAEVLKNVEPKKAQNSNQMKIKKSKSKSPAMKWRSKLADKITPRRKNSKRRLIKSTNVQEQLIAKKRSRTQNYGGPAYLKLYEMSKHQQSDGKKRRDEIDRRNQESKSMTFTHITRAHTAENRIRENRERRDRMQATLQARFDYSRTAHSMTSAESAELYDRLVKQKKRTEERLEALRRQTL